MRTSDEIKAEIEKLKAEYKEARNAEKRNIPDILYIDGVGWVKKLPCAPDASVFVAYVCDKKYKSYLHEWSVSGWSKCCKEDHQGEYTIEKVQMRPAWYNYNQIGRTIFLTEDEARTKIQEYLKRVE
jgi:hypothetical protein